MTNFQGSATAEDLVELSKQGYFTIMLDENLRAAARIDRRSSQGEGSRVVAGC
jgi:hypothetical protein